MSQADFRADADDARPVLRFIRRINHRVELNLSLVQETGVGRVSKKGVRVDADDARPVLR